MLYRGGEKIKANLVMEVKTRENERGGISGSISLKGLSREIVQADIFKESRSHLCFKIAYFTSWDRVE